MWKLSDGTMISASAEITGDSDVAADMRGSLEITDRLPILVQAKRAPRSLERLDVSDVASLDSWVRQVARLAGVTVTQAPILETVEPADAADDDRVY